MCKVRFGAEAPASSLQHQAALLLLAMLNPTTPADAPAAWFTLLDDLLWAPAAPHRDHSADSSPVSSCCRASCQWER